MGRYDLNLSLDTTKSKRNVTPADKKRTAALQGWICKRCRKKLPVRYHVDHIKPLSRGGSNKDSNLQALCGTCHDNKTEDDRVKAKRKKKTRTPSLGSLLGGKSNKLKFI